MIKRLYKEDKIVIDSLNSNNKNLKFILDRSFYDVSNTYDWDDIKFEYFYKCFIDIINDENIEIKGYINSDFKYSGADIKLKKFLSVRFKNYMDFTKPVDDIRYVN